MSSFVGEIIIISYFCHDYKLEGDCARYMVRGAKDGVMNSVFGLGSEIQGILDAFGVKVKE